MPGLNATIGADGSQMEREYARMEALSARTAQRIQQNIIQGNRSSTIGNPTQRKSSEEQYLEWWGRAMANKQEEAAKRALERRNQHAREVASYEERQAEKAEGAKLYRAQQTEEQIDQARRNIRARALRRERAASQAERMAGMDMSSVPENLRGWNPGRRGGGYGGPGAARAFGGASSAMFVSVARDSLASLASGASPITVFLQQAPQVGQAFTMMGSKIASLLLPTGLVIAGLAGLGYAVGKAAQGLGALGVEGSGEALGRVRDEIRKTLRARLEALRLEREEAARVLAERRAAAAAGYLGRLDDIGRVRMENRVLEAKTPEEAKKIKGDYLKDQMDYARIAYENTKKDAYNRADPIAQKAADDAALAFETARNAYLTFQKTGDDNRTTGETKSGGKSINMLTDWERAGGSLGSNNLMLDVSKAQLTELKTIKEILRGRGMRGVQF